MSPSDIPVPDQTGTIQDPDALQRLFTKRYRGASITAIEKVLVPVPVPIRSIDKEIARLPKCSHYSAGFTVSTEGAWSELMQPGCTGKFVPSAYVVGDGVWREIAKGRILSIDRDEKCAYGEIYLGARSTKPVLGVALEQLTENDFWEIDQYGASAKVLSGLVEYSLARRATAEGFTVRRMPADVARHIGVYYSYDFEFERDGISKKIEVKSLWGTNTSFARLIHSKTTGYITSSCKFSTQDIFAVNLFLRTGNIEDFAFAVSISSEVVPFGLPRSTKSENHVTQNPICEIGNGSWFATIDEVWKLLS